MGELEAVGGEGRGVGGAVGLTRWVAVVILKSGWVREGGASIVLVTESLPRPGTKLTCVGQVIGEIPTPHDVQPSSPSSVVMLLHADAIRGGTPQGGVATRAGRLQLHEVGGTPEGASHVEVGGPVQDGEASGSYV